MSAGFDLAVIGALLKLSVSSSSQIACLALCCCMILCCFQQSLNLGFPSVSMRLRPKRFVGFSLFPFLSIFLLFRSISCSGFCSDFVFVSSAGLVLE